MALKLLINSYMYIRHKCVINKILDLSIFFYILSQFRQIVNDAIVINTHTCMYFYRYTSCAPWFHRI